MQNKFKHGDRVTCTIQGTKIDDARISISGGCFYICQNKKAGTKPPETFGYTCGWSIGSNYYAGKSDVHNLRLTRPTLDNLDKDDHVIDSDGVDYTVLGCAGGAIFMTETKNLKKPVCEYYPIESLKDLGFSVVEPVLKYTRQELEEILGHKFEIVDCKE